MKYNKENKLHKQLIKFLNLDTEAVRVGQEAIDMTFGQGIMRGCVPRDKTNFKMMVKELNKCFNDVPKVPKKMEIIGGGPACNCHQNTRRAVLFWGKDNVEYVRGYNFTFTPDGIGVSAEIHTVMKCKITGNYFDYTTDFAGEKSKVFLECEKLQDKYTYTEKIFPDRRCLDYITSFKRRHICRVSGRTYDVNENMMFVDKLRPTLEKYNFYNWEKPSYMTYKMNLTIEQIEYLEKIGWGKHNDMDDYDIRICEDEGQDYQTLLNTTSVINNNNTMIIGGEKINLAEIFGKGVEVHHLNFP